MGGAARENHTKEPVAEPPSVVLGPRGEATGGPVRGRAKPKLTQQRGEAKPRTRDSQLGAPPPSHTAFLKPQDQQGPQFKETKLPLLLSFKGAGIQCTEEVKPLKS